MPIMVARFPRTPCVTRLEIEGIRCRSRAHTGVRAAFLNVLNPHSRTRRIDRQFRGVAVAFSMTLE